MKSDIVFEDENVLVVNKASGLVVNRSLTIKEKTLQDELSDYFSLSDLGIGDRAGIVHRLDRETSGLMVVAKKERVFEFLQNQFREREVKKEYVALVHGKVKLDSGSMRGALGRIGKFGKFGIVEGGRLSQTDWETKKRLSFKRGKFERFVEKLALSKNRQRYLEINAREYSMLRIKPKTGRTHQIRVHLKSLGNPVVSDSIYAPSKIVKFDRSWCPRLFLHASYLEFKLAKRRLPMIFKSDLPNDLKNAILNLS